MSGLDREQQGLISFLKLLPGPGENSQHQQKQTSDSVEEHCCDVKPGFTGSHCQPVATNFTAWAACFTAQNAQQTHLPATQQLKLKKPGILSCHWPLLIGHRPLLSGHQPLTSTYQSTAPVAIKQPLLPSCSPCCHHTAPAAIMQPLLQSCTPQSHHVYFAAPSSATTSSSVSSPLLEDW